jgi:hypothetical protein
MPRNKAKGGQFSAADLANLRNNPYIHRLIEDAKLRENLRMALDSTKSAYSRLTNGVPAHRALLEDKKLHRDLQHAIAAAREATLTLTEAPKKRKRMGFGRKLLFVIAGFTLALAVSEKLRSKVLDTLFGAEEEFQYTPPAGPAATPPATPVTAA